MQIEGKLIKILEAESGTSKSGKVYSREYNGKYYNQIDGWRFSKSGNNTDTEDFMTSDDMPF